MYKTYTKYIKIYESALPQHPSLISLVFWQCRDSNMTLHNIFGMHPNGHPVCPAPDPSAWRPDPPDGRVRRRNGQQQIRPAPRRGTWTRFPDLRQTGLAQPRNARRDDARAQEFRTGHRFDTWPQSLGARQGHFSGPVGRHHGRSRLPARGPVLRLRDQARPPPRNRGNGRAQERREIRHQAGRLALVLTLRISSRHPCAPAP